MNSGEHSTDERILSCAACGAVLGVVYVGDRIPDGHQCCEVCSGEGWVWEFVDCHPVKAPCFRCGSRQMSLPTEEEVNRMGASHVA